MKRTAILLSILLISFGHLYAGKRLRVLFLGNSYTQVNNLPDVISKLASAGGDSLYYAMYAPGGYTLQQHSTDPAALALIAQGNWDYVVLQDQSQLPSFEDGQVASEVYPYAKKLDSLIRVEMGDCARVMFYMTWGRKNGDASNCAIWPPVCTYQGMDSLLQLRYSIMADSNSAYLSPVAKVWRNLRTNTPGIELYQADESHPTVAGTYAAAMSFYAIMFNKNPTENSFNASLSTANALAIKVAAQTEVYVNRGEWKQYGSWPFIDSIGVETNGTNAFHFIPVNPGNVISFSWDFGDGSALSNSASPTHTYPQSGTYTACLVITSTCASDTFCTQVNVNVTGINESHLLSGITVYPNPAKDDLHIDGITGKVSYALCDVTGTQVSHGAVAPAHNNINLRGLAAGLYFLNLSDDKGHKLVLKITRQ